MSRRATVAVASLLALTLVVPMAVDCTVGLMAMASTQMACCDDGRDTCPAPRPSHGSSAQCCTASSERQQQLASSEHRPAASSAGLSAQIVALATRVAGPIPLAPLRLSRIDNGADRGSPPRPFLATVLLI